jgi:hypothetical protein
VRIATRVELAFGADLTADSATWSWTDASTYVLGSVSIAFGRANEASSTQPATCSLRLRNSDGRFSPRLPTSPYYPNVRRQTPVRVSLNPGGTGYVQRFQGYVDQFTPTWPSGRTTYAEMMVVASGTFRRLIQGSTPVRSALYRAISQTSPLAYWPLEDGPGSTMATGLQVVGPMQVTAGKVAFASAAGAAGSAPLASFSSDGIGGQLTGIVPVAAVATSWRVEFVTKFNAIQPAEFVAALAWETSGGVGLWEIDAAQLVDGGLSLQYIDSSGGFGGPYASNVQVDDGAWHHIRVDATQSGGDIALTVKLDGVTVITQTLAGLAMGGVGSVVVNPTVDPSEQVPAVGHVAVWSPFSSSVDTVAAFRGNAGETAGARITRLCLENNVPASVSSTTGTALMGPQSVTTLLALLRECETADGGILYDGQSAGITYLARQDRYNLPVALALDCAVSQVQLPFAPTEDDQLIRNDWTVSRTGGSSDQYNDEVHVAANGRYDSSATVNVQYDADLRDQAGWRVNLGTIEEMRVPGLSLQLINHSELWTSWLALTLGERLTAVNLPPQYPPGTLDMIAEGYTEAWDEVNWQVAFNTSPFAPWRIFVIAADAGDTAEFVGHLAPDDSALNAAITTTAASFAVKTNSGPLWTTTADDFPFDINVGGEQIRVNSISGAASPQTFSVTRSRNGVVKAHLINASVSLWAPLVLGL